ncbi:MAG TPA: DNA-protecting protein DprA, partial [Microterricola sp.]
MAEFGLNDREMRALIAPLRSPAAEPSTSTGDAELFARAAWTGIAEPGDRGAGLLVTALGAATALNAVIEQWPTARIAEAVDPTAHAGRDALAHEISAALARWRPRVNSAAAVRALQS